MSSEEDDDLKSLRTALLSSIRSKNQNDERSQEIYDTDIDDLEALRKAALKSVKPEVKTLNYNPTYISSAHILRPNTLGLQFPAQLPLGNAQYQQRFPPFRLRPPPVVLRPQIRSNLIVIQTMPDGNDIPLSAAASSTTNATTSQLILPQDRYNKNFTSSSATVEKVKRNDKWSRFEEDSSSSDSDEEEINTVDEVNMSRSDESEQENEILSDECAGRVSPKMECNSSFEEITSLPLKNVEPVDSRASPSSETVAFSQQMQQRIFADDERQFSFDNSLDSSFSVETDRQIIDKPVQKRTVVIPTEKKKPLPFDEFDFLLEEPSDSIEFLEDEPVDYEAIVASMNNNDATTVASTTTDNDSPSSASNDDNDYVSSSAQISNEKERLKSKLNEVTRKLAEIRRDGRHQRQDSPASNSKSDDKKHKSSRNKHRPERNRRNDDRHRHLPDSSRAIDVNHSETSNFNKTDRRSPVVLSSVVAVRKDSSSSNKKRKRKGNSPELREHVLRKAALPSLLELKIERTKTNAASASSEKITAVSPAKKLSSPSPSPSKSENSSINITKGDLRAFLTSKKSTPTTNVLPSTSTTPMAKNILNKANVINLKSKGVPPPVSDRFDDPETPNAKKIHLDTSIRRTIVNNSATITDEKFNQNIKEKTSPKSFPSPFESKEASLARRVILGTGERLVELPNRQQRQGNPSFPVVHVQWKKSGAETIKEGKSTGGKIKLKRP